MREETKRRIEAAKLGFPPGKVNSARLSASNLTEFLTEVLNKKWMYQKPDEMKVAKDKAREHIKKIERYLGL